MPYWCTDCRSYFSVRTGTPIARSNVPLRKWEIAIYLCLTSMKAVSSMKFHRDIGVSQPTAWFMLHRSREAGAEDSDDPLDGPAEVDETYFGGKRETCRWRSARRSRAVTRSVRRTLSASRTGTVERSGPKWSSTRTVRRSRASGATVYTDDAAAYKGMPEYDHEAVNHSVSEYDRGQAHTSPSWPC